MAIDKVKVTGVKFFDGNVDGKNIDSGTVFIEQLLDFRNGTAKGCAVTAYPLASSKEAKALMNHDFPLTCEVEFLRLTTGKGDKTVVNSLRPVLAAAAASAPAR